MPQTQDLPAEGLDPWYAAMTAAWEDMQAFVNTLESGKADTGHTHTSANISDFTEAVQDAVAALLAAGTGVTLTYNDAGNSLTVAATGGGGSGDPEVIRDTIGVAMVGAGVISVVVNDAADTITISTTATANSTDAQLRDRATHTGTQAQSTVTNLVSDLALKAPLASPAFTGTPTAPTATAGDSDTQLATTAFVQQEIGLTTIEDLADVDSIPDQALLMRDGANIIGVEVEDSTALDIPYGVSNTVAAALDELFTRMAAVESSSPALVNSVLPTITGTFTVGATVTAVTGSWTVGGVSQTPDSYTYQWRRNGANISGATSSTYVLASDDIGTDTVDVRVTAIKAGYTNGIATSAAIDVSAGVVPLSIQATSEGHNSAAADLVIPKPSGVVNGDYLLAGLRSQTSAGASDFTATAPSGTWTRLGPAWPGSTSAARVQGFYGHRVSDAGTEPASYEFDRTSAATRNAGVIINLRGVPTSSFVSVSSADYYGTDITHGKTVAALTVPNNDSFQFVIAAAEFTTGNDHVPTTPAGFSLVAASVTDGAVVGSSRTYVAVFYREVDAGTAAAVNVVWPSAAGSPVAHSIVIRPE
jgi:hypothetical protein